MGDEDAGRIALRHGGAGRGDRILLIVPRMINVFPRHEIGRQRTIDLLVDLVEIGRAVSSVHTSETTPNNPNRTRRKMASLA